jgi:hypothetical protein
MVRNTAFARAVARAPPATRHSDIEGRNVVAEEQDVGEGVYRQRVV